MPYLPPTVSIVTLFPGALNEPSYLDIAITSQSTLNPAFSSGGSTIYDAWCLDEFAHIDVNTTYTASVYSSYEIAILQASPLSISAFAQAPYIGNLDNINWLLNFYTGPSSGYTMGEVQATIWKLIGQDVTPVEAVNLAPFDPAKVITLTNLALTTGEGYVPTLGQAIGIIIDTVDANGVRGQPLIIESRAAALGDFVWEDKNANGLQDSGEAGIAGVTVQLVRDLDNNGVIGAGEILATTTTDSLGKYGFGALTPGLDYQVQFTQPGGYVTTTCQVDGNVASGVNSDGLLTNVVKLAPGENNTTLDAGFYKLAALGDRVWYDTNNNGTQDSGEANAPGVKVHLFNASGVEISTQTTTASGNYLFTNLVPGSYSVKFDAPTNYGFTLQNTGGNSAGSEPVDSDADSSGTTAQVTLSSGQTYLDLDAGLVATASAHLGDYVWEDKNANGIQDANEAGVAGVLVTLYNASGTAIGTTTTAANGLYGFDVLPGTYSVGFAPTSGFVFTAPNVSANGFDATDSDADVMTGRTGQYTVAAGQSNLTIDAGIYKLAQLGDRVWFDANANGIQDSAEGNAAGVTVSLLNSAGTVVATQLTNATGNYLFTNLVPGTYSVQFAAPMGYAFTSKDANGNASDAADSDADTTTGKTGTYTLQSGDSNLTVDAGLVALKAHLGDRVWLDANADGIQDASEVAVANVTVNLKNSVGTVIATTTTNPSGIYGFDVDPGTYSVQFVKPANYVLTTKDAAGNTLDATDSDADVTTGNTATYTLAAGQSNLTIDAGLYKLAQLGDRVWFDANANGIQDSGETNAVGVTVSLLNAVGTVVATQVTNATGNYLFTNLVPGTYSVQFTAPTGYRFTSKDASGNTLDATDSDADTTTGKTGTYTLASGDSNLTVDAGLVPIPVVKAHLGDRVWLDTNANGVQDAGEVGIASVTVNLKNAAGAVIATTATNASGIYGFDVDPGTYSVQFVKPAGYVATGKDVGGNTVGADAVDSDADPTTGNTGSYTLAGGDNNLTIDAGLYQLAAIGDRIWYDKNANGIQDAGETNISGVTVDLKDAATGAVVASQATDTNGNYLFTVKPGNYFVDIQEATLPAGFIFTKPNQGANDAVDSDVQIRSDQVQYGATLQWGQMASTTLDSGETDRTWDAGVYRIGVDIEKYVSGTTCTTTNVCGGEGASVGWWKSNCSGGVNWSVVSCKGTDTFSSIFGVSCTNGSKSLYSILSGTSTAVYDVWQRECVAAFLNASANNCDYAYSRDQVCTDVKYALSCGDYSDCSTKLSHENSLGCSFSNAQDTYNCTVDTQLYDADSPPGLEVKTGSLVTFTYIVKNTGDTALSNVVVTDDRIASITFVGGDSNNNGLLDLAETWTYKATEVATAGTIKNTGTVVGTDSVGGVSKATDDDVAYYTGTGATKGSIGDRLWVDKDFDGIQESGEAGLGGVKVVLRGAGADNVFGTADDITATTTTSSTGAYLFSNLAAGKYQVDFSDAGRLGYLATKANVGNDAADSDIDSSGKTGVVTLGSGEQNLTVDAGVYQKACVGDKVWEDKNHNGIQDAGEAGIGGITVKLLSTSGSVLGTTTTNSAGNYQFTNLDPGSYVLQFDKTNVQYNGYNMSTWKWGVKNVGSNDAIDSDVAGDGVALTNVTKTDAFTLTSGQSDQTRDAAITPLVINLDGKGIHTTSLENSGGTFDLLGNGTAIHSGWIATGSGFLAVDKNGNGSIDNVNELFGGTGKGAGFANLAAYDSNHDGAVNAADADFAKLLIWQDLNGDHASSADELMTLAQAGIASLSLAATDLQFADAEGNYHGEASTVTTVSGALLGMTDVYFGVSAADATAAGVSLPTVSELLGINTLDSLVGPAAACTTDVARVSAEHACDCGDSGEALRRLAMLTREEAHAAI